MQRLPCQPGKSERLNPVWVDAQRGSGGYPDAWQVGADAFHQRSVMRTATADIKFMCARAFAVDCVGEARGGEFEQSGLHVGWRECFIQAA